MDHAAIAAQADVPGSSAVHAAAASPSSAAAERELTDQELVDTPFFLLNGAQRDRARRILDERRQAVAAAAEEDAASNGLSLPEGAELIDDWVSTAPSTATREQRERELERKEAARRLKARAKDPEELRKCPYN